MDKRGEIADFGGGSLEPPRPWLGLALRVPSCPEPPEARCGGTGGELGHCQGGTMLLCHLPWQRASGSAPLERASGTNCPLTMLLCHLARRVLLRTARGAGGARRAPPRRGERAALVGGGNFVLAHDDGQQPAGCQVANAVLPILKGQRVKGSKIGDFGGGSLEPPRPWRGARWLGLALGVPSCPEPPGAPRGGAGAELGHRQGGHVERAVPPTCRCCRQRGCSYLRVRACAFQLARSCCSSRSYA